MNAGSEAGSKLRDILRNNTSPLARQLFQEFQTIEARANEEWIPLLGHDKGSHSGHSHLQGVEEQISGILESTPDLNLSPAESFILLCGVIFHDLGKIVSQEKFDDIKKSKEIEHSFYNKHLSVKVKDAHHGIVSAVFLLAEYHRFGFTDLGIVTCIAHVCAAHDTETAKKLRNTEKLRDRYLDQYGRIRLSWLCTLLTLGDELDNSYHRAAPKWLRPQTESKDNEKGRLRAKLSGCEINKPGKLLEVHLNRNLYEPYLKETTEKKFGGAEEWLPWCLSSDMKETLENKHGEENLLFRVWHDLVIKKKMLSFWKDELKQMHVNITDAGLNINGHLISPRRNKIEGNPTATLKMQMYFKNAKDKVEAQERIDAARIEPFVNAKSESDDKPLLEISISDPDDYNKNQSEKSVTQRSESLSVTDFENDSCLSILEKIQKILEGDNTKKKKLQWHIGFDSFQISFEPSITPMRVDRLLDTALQLRFQTHGITAIPWETLATEAGFEHLDEVKLIFHRISLLARIYFHDENSSGDKLLMDKLKEMPPKPPMAQNPIRLRFIELDGEWAIELLDKYRKIVSNIRDVKEFNKMACQFHKWLKAILVGQEALPTYENCGSSNPIERYLKIRNRELSYLLNENISDEDIFDEDIFDENISDGLLETPTRGLTVLSLDKTCSHKPSFCDPSRLTILLSNLYTGFKKNDAKAGGILFPKSRSYINHDGQKNIGMNMVISGPAGVGKSTLSMEMLAKEKFSANPEIPLYAYYSLEQPTESICEMAKNLGFIKDQIYDSLPETLPKKNKPILFLPKLAPRTYGDGISEDRLFWFRYHQIVDLFELMRDPNFNPERRYVLTAIVIDSLNAFSRSPLARQQIHQVFKLVSWYGILGIHIIENDPASESGSFQSEVEFLSDIAIRLGWNRDKYQYKVMEIVKSRCQRHVLGRHPFKIRLIPKDGNNQTTIYKSNTSSYGFEIYPSLHTQISRSAKKDTEPKHNDASIGFSCNNGLNGIVHKDGNETGILDDAFIALQGRSGGHKLAIGMSYIHANRGRESALILNLGQPIIYNSVAGSHSWWEDGKKYKKQIGLIWPGSSKLNVDLYHARPEMDGVIYVLNFHAGFLLPEEFLQAVKFFIKDVKNNNNLYPIKRVLFNSTAHLPERYPLLADNPLFLHALVRILKQKRISLMTIGVKGSHHEDRVMGLSTMSDINVNIHDFTDETLHPCCKHELLNKLKTSGLPSSNIRVITSDNITGKDYLKRYALLEVTSQKSADAPKKQKIELSIVPIKIKPCDSAD